MLKMNKPEIARHGENNFIPIETIPEGAKLIESGKSLIVGR